MADVRIQIVVGLADPREVAYRKIPDDRELQWDCFGYE
jgi:hypothetical protein